MDQIDELDSSSNSSDDGTNSDGSDADEVVSNFARLYYTGTRAPQICVVLCLKLCNGLSFSFILGSPERRSVVTKEDGSLWNLMGGCLIL